MEQIRPSQSPPPPPTATTTTTASTAEKIKQAEPAMSRFRKDCLSFGVSLQEDFRYVKATFVGQAKMITARNEKEATAAALQAAKMQVEAADEAENKKKSPGKISVN